MTALPELTEPQIRRYARHIVLAEIGGVGQARLIAARVLVIGAGGLGAPLLQYLAAAGIGTLGVIDTTGSISPTCSARSSIAPRISASPRFQAPVARFWTSTPRSRSSRTTSVSQRTMPNASWPATISWPTAVTTSPHATY